MFNLVAFIIMVAGGLNWLCIGIFQFDIIAGIFGSQAHFISRFLYSIIGLASLYLLSIIPFRKGQLYTPQKDKKQKK